MNARATFALPELPLDGGGTAIAPQLRPVEGETFVPTPQYRRLFGSIPPDQVMMPVDPGTSPQGDGNLGSPPAHCDPAQAASHPVHALLAGLGHPSALTLAAIAALRSRHLEKGHTPAEDAAHGWIYFKRLSDEAYRAAIGARSAATRRERLIIAIAILVAQLDAEDFLASQQETTLDPL